MPPLPAIEVTTGHDPKTAVIWMHGLGADGHDFVPVVKELGLPDDFPVRFVFPHAPMRPVTINGGHVMRAWYDIALDGLDRRADAQGIRESQADIERLIDRERTRGIDSRRIVLAGFSQGGAIALQTALRHRERLAGILALSTYLPLADTLTAEAAPANADIPIFMAHGTQDQVIPIAMAKDSEAKLEAAGYPVEFHAYPMPHSVCMEEIEAIGRWLRSHAAG
jgi:phospholipase/carboxylesterase